MNSEDYVLVRMLWPGDVDRTVLTRARRCLLEAAPVQLHDTGFQLVRQDHYYDICACVLDALHGHRESLEGVLVSMSCPDPEEQINQEIFRLTFKDILFTVQDELLTCSDQLQEGKKPTVRFLNKVDKAVECCEEHVYTSPELAHFYTIYKKLRAFPFAKQGKKGEQYLRALALKLKQLEESL